MDDAGCFDDRLAWPDSGLTTDRRWLEALWNRIASGAPEIRQQSLMSARQSLALWRQVIEESEAGEFLLDRTGVARACAASRRALLDHELLPADQGGPEWAGDPATFLVWAQRFEAVLAERRWIDPDSLLFRVGRLSFTPCAAVRLLDAESLLPAMRRLQQNWVANGRLFERVEPPPVVSRMEAILAGDAEHELALTADWAARMLAQFPRGRVAVVAPDLEQRRSQLTRGLAELLGHERVWCERGTPVSEMGPFGAALSLLAMLSAQRGFPALSRWLRSPFFSAYGDLRGAMALEMQLRSDSRSEEPFADAYRRHGLRLEIRATLPDEVARLDSALARVPARATPTGWVGIWQACLRDLDWNAASAAQAEAIAAWDAAMGAFAELTPILGDIDGATALAEFEAIAAGQTVFRPPIAHGVHLLRSVADVGPGYAGVWVTGFSDQTWPEPPEVQPLLPWTVRVAHAMPGARPEDTLALGRLRLARLLRRTATVRFSCPARRADEPLTPCPQVGPWHKRERAEYAGARGFAASRIGARAIVHEADPAPPHTGRHIRGGARTLDLQASCPVRAFCETRLGARVLEPAEQGLSPRLRGLLVHRTLELLLEPAVAEPPAKRVERSIETAFGELTRSGRPLWNAQLDIERARVRRLIDAFLTLERERQPFQIVDLERRVEIEIAGRTLRCRIDRVDRLPSGSQLLIDYKTGKRLHSGWFNDRLSDSQLPLYAQQFPETIAAIVMIQLTEGRIEYRAAGIDANDVPGRHTDFDEESAWRAQIVLWSEQLTSLLDEYVAGDVRLRAADTSAADGPYAPLTRVKALLA